MLTISGWIFLGLGALIAALPDLLHMRARREIAPGAHRAVCIALFVLGCVARLWRLDSMPYGISAEEALVGVQAKALWQTGGFLFHGHLTAQLSQWAGESCGPLLATLTAPCVGLGGMTPLMTRLPLALLSCAAMPAAYALGMELSGKRAARWSLTCYALCPYFVLAARLTCGANVAVCLLPVAVWLLVRGMKRAASLYAGVLLMALLAYAQDMYFFISPLAVVLSCVIAAIYGMKKRHAFGAMALGLIVCTPAMLTLWVNLAGKEAFTLLGIVEIPRLERFDKADWFYRQMAEPDLVLSFQNKLWIVLVSGVFQCVRHANIANGLLVPDGMLALYAISAPLIALGALSLFARRAGGARVSREMAAKRTLIAALALVTCACLTAYGSESYANIAGPTSAFDYSSLFLFDVLLMVAGLCRIERKSAACACAVTVLFAVSAGFLGAHLLGGDYQANANVYFDGFGELSAQAAQIQEKTGARVNVTDTVYPHISPDEAAEFMYLYATDADMRQAAKARGTDYEVSYLRAIESPDASQIYLVTANDTLMWDYAEFDYAEAGQYLLLTPAGE